MAEQTKRKKWSDVKARLEAFDRKGLVSLASCHPEVLPVAAVGWATFALGLATALFGNVIEFWSLPSATHSPPRRWISRPPGRAPSVRRSLEI